MYISASPSLDSDLLVDAFDDSDDDDKQGASERFLLVWPLLFLERKRRRRSVYRLQYSEHARAVARIVNRTTMGTRTNASKIRFLFASLRVILNMSNPVLDRYLPLLLSGYL